MLKNKFIITDKKRVSKNPQCPLFFLIVFFGVVELSTNIAKYLLKLHDYLVTIELNPRTRLNPAHSGIGSITVSTC